MSLYAAYAGNLDARLMTRRIDTTLIGRLNALVARLYCLSEDDLAHVLGSFPLVPEAERRAALLAYRDRG